MISFCLFSNIANQPLCTFSSWYIARISIKFVFTSDQGCLFCHMKREAYLHWHRQVDQYAEGEEGLASK